MRNRIPEVTVNAEIQGGTPCFTGTRVPVKALFDVLSHGRTLDYFIENFSSVTMEQARAVLACADRLIQSDAKASVEASAA